MANTSLYQALRFIHHTGSVSGTSRSGEAFASHHEQLVETAVVRAVGMTVMMEQIAKIDRALDELLVGLGEMVLRLGSPSITRTHDEREALARSVNQFSTCAARSADPRVLRLAEQLQETLKPRLRLVSSRN